MQSPARGNGLESVPEEGGPGGGEDHNALVIDAVENGDVAALTRALAAGGSPNSRKKVTVTARLPWKRASLWGGSDGAVVVSDTRNCESALALAIRSQRDDIVQLLLSHHRTDVNASVHWNIADGSVKWTREQWDATKGWAPEGKHKSRSLLDFALERGPRRFNPPGAHVTFTNPTPTDHRYDEYELTPSPTIVQLLLSKGALVGDTTIEAAMQLDTIFMELVKRQLQQPAGDRRPVPPPRPVSMADSTPSSPGGPGGGSSVGGSSVAPPPGPSADQLLQLHTVINSLQAKLARRDERVAELEAAARRSKVQVAELEGTVTGLKTVVESLRQQLSTDDYSKVRCVTVAYEPREPGEIRVQPGDIVCVKREFTDGWCVGFSMSSGEEGIFPLESSQIDPDTPPVFPRRTYSKVIHHPTVTPIAAASPDSASSSLFGSVTGSMVRRSHSTRTRQGRKGTASISSFPAA